jgi:hypothetical protein
VASMPEELMQVTVLGVSGWQSPLEMSVDPERTRDRYQAPRHPHR